MTTLVTAIWRRPELTRKFLDYWNAFEELELVAAVSPEDPDKPEPVGRWQFVEAPNIPLSLKFQAAVDAVPRGSNVMVMGSDDFACPGFVKSCIALMENGWDVIQPMDIYLYEPPSDVAWYCPNWPVGAGRCYSSRLMEKVGYKVWTEPDNRKLDTAAAKQLLPHTDRERIKPYQNALAQTTLLDYKTGGNMWGLHETLKHLPKAQSVPMEAVVPAFLR